MRRFLRFFGLCLARDAERQVWALHCELTRIVCEINALKAENNKLRYDVGNYSAACKGYRQQLSRLDEQIIH